MFLTNPHTSKGKAKAKAKGTFIFTGATWSVQSGARLSTIGPSLFARRALAQSLAEEFSSQGVHVTHVIVEGRIDPSNEGKVRWKRWSMTLLMYL